MADNLHAQAMGLAHSVILKQLIQHLRMTTDQMKSVFDGADWLLDVGPDKNDPIVQGAHQHVDFLAKACGARL